MLFNSISNNEIFHVAITERCFNDYVVVNGNVINRKFCCTHLWEDLLVKTFWGIDKPFSHGLYVVDVLNVCSEISQFLLQEYHDLIVLIEISLVDFGTLEIYLMFDIFKTLAYKRSSITKHSSYLMSGLFSSQRFRILNFIIVFLLNLVDGFETKSESWILSNVKQSLHIVYV